MTFTRKKIGATGVGLALLAFGLVQAEAALGSSLVGGPAAQTETAPDASGSDVERSPQEILEEARTTLDRMEAAADNISLQLRRAREEKDVVKMLCLDDKLSQMNVAARSATDRVASIESAVTTGNADRARHDDAVLGALSERANELVAEANQCIGEETGVLGQTKLELTVDPSIPTADTAAPPVATVISNPPAAASPTS